jgi:hypothetical protein
MRGVLQPGRKGIDLIGRQPVFKIMGSAMPLGLGEPRLVCQIAFPQAMRSKDVQSQLSPGLRKADALALRLDEASALESLQHLRRLIHAQPDRPRHTLYARHDPVDLGLVKMLECVLDSDTLSRPRRVAPA